MGVNKIVNTISLAGGVGVGYGGYSFAVRYYRNAPLGGRHAAFAGVGFLTGYVACLALFQQLDRKFVLGE
ncbi:hypothetical protein AMAG_20639 [Allomyces macrogynus ATCC 38327]|uniref:Uncharacterized protein n=1 Tax=Allomyces macrogynus (strain ATCC 38327) TaxID=578462 RepID=A0A0L0TDG6_ALLM3|nr:hypothetical protein GGF32_001219 [Allomyces javanicus]KAJ3366824.1 hypothetical protein GGF31_007977 [Allomyces arbusculus]KNE58325.1 hypothetical protein AMAG_18223 [Allomyces macrogynus ATCC 38327]KNE72933.1 hypothetical protein AMAG_20639 [Allomyces macrogynus ATCC 38327]|eukprot:KNE58325.1 hypothetical protein AMAG_18223 [Allomyces macrogynus ATCC 38327]